MFRKVVGKYVEIFTGRTIFHKVTLIRKQLNKSEQILQNFLMCLHFLTCLNFKLNEAGTGIIILDVFHTGPH
jgi:hypothetical protein